MTDDHDNTGENATFPPSGLLPYERWLNLAYRSVMINALEHVSREGLAGDHHFYLTFRTDFPGVEIPARLRAQYPHEMTIVLQHQFWDLKVDHETDIVSVGLSFGGVGTTLVIPVWAFTGFADPSIGFSLQFAAEELEDEAAEEAHEEHTPEESGAETQGEAASQVVSLDAFRRKGPSPA
ncbi:SspB family protein [Acetobacter papayae]|uniref:SspB family protein n=1 Tax=Acetobacter papayae TaxID=1076592 RepID=UPI00047080BA|nr:ClpXP protease specificity-enhancing factor SspB [Acetobacter papayae]